MIEFVKPLDIVPGFLFSKQTKVSSPTEDAHACMALPFYVCVCIL